MRSAEAWRVRDIICLTLDRPHIQDFLDGRCAGLRFPQFLRAGLLENVVEAITAVGLEHYEGDDKNGQVVRKRKLGPNFYRFRNDPDEYFRRAESARRVFEERILHAVNVQAFTQDLMATVFALPTQVAEHRGQRMMGCTVRDLPAAPIHRDWMPGETSRLAFAPELTEQFAWNVYLRPAQRGGQTRIYAVEDPQHVDDDSPYDEVQPRAGDLMVFRSTLAHQVMPSQGERLTLSGFFGRTADRILFWV